MRFSNKMIVGAVVGAGMVALSSAASAGVNCRSMLWGNGIHSLKLVARGQARRDWRANAGPGWNSLVLAKQKSRVCRRESHHGGGSKWHCVFKAKPCRRLGLRQ